MTLGVSTASIARLRALASLKSDLQRGLDRLQAQGQDSPTLRQSLQDVAAETASLERTIMAARASQ